MKEEIQNKLKELISSGFSTEANVVYFFVEVRKLLQHSASSRRNEYPLLYFYCDWVVHIKMDRDPARKILQRLINFFEEESPGTDANVEFISFEGLRTEICNFCNEMGIDESLSSQILDDGWHNFRKLLLMVLINCPLTSLTEKVREFSFITTPDTPDMSGVYFITYQAKLADDKIVQGSILLGDQSKEFKEEAHKRWNGWWRRKLIKKGLITPTEDDINDILGRDQRIM